MGRNVLTGPGLADLDFSLFKNFQIVEKVRLQFRSEFFNIFNHPNFAPPVSNLSLFGAKERREKKDQGGDRQVDQA